MQHSERYNLFNLIHKGLRHLLYDASLDLQRTDFRSHEAAERALRQIEVVLDYFESHAEVEDSFILPVIGRYHPALVVDFESQHVEDHRLATLLQDLIADVKNTGNPHERDVASVKLLHAFNEFIAFNLYHMNKEEAHLNKILWQYFSDAELHAITRQIIQHMPPKKVIAMNRWMMRSINLKEAAEWMAGIRKGAPSEVYQQYLQLAAEELDGVMHSELMLLLTGQSETGTTNEKIATIDLTK